MKTNATGSLLRKKALKLASERFCRYLDREIMLHLLKKKEKDDK